MTTSHRMPAPTTPARLSLSDEQLAIIEHPREPLRVAAGAGTGKTTTIVERLAEAVRSGIDPARAVGITFTNKAADELRQRLRESIGSRHDGREVEVATYHSFASSILDEFGSRIGHRAGAVLMDEGHRSELAARVLRGLTGTTLDLTALDHRRDEVLAVADSLNDNLRTAHDLIALAPRVPDDIWDKRVALAEAAHRFAAEKADLGLTEYADLIRLAVEILTEHPDVAREIAGRYDMVLLDEYQDTDPAQRLMLTTIFAGGPPVTAVGDTDQTIYEWRGASIENFERFPGDFTTSGGEPAVTLPLSVNRRSDSAILELANLLRSNLPTLPGAEPLRPRSGADQGAVTTAWFRSDGDEAAWIAEQILERSAEGTPFIEMAVLCRNREMIRPIAAALRTAGVPFAVGSLGELLKVPEITDLHAWLTIIADPTRDADALRILLGGKYRLGLADVGRIRSAAHEHGSNGLIGEILEHGAPPGAPSRARDALDRFAVVFRALFIRSHAASVARIVDDLVDTLDLWAEVAALPPARSTTVRLNLNRFIDLAGQWRPLDGHGTLAAFLRYLRALDETGRSDALDTAEVPLEDAVVLSTVHGAKGLEWSDVYLPALADKVFPTGVRLYQDPLRSALVLPFDLRLDRDAVRDLMDEPSEDRRKDILRERHLHQEWRLAYVAVTRARHRLTLSGHAWDGEIKNPRAPSPILELARDLPSATAGPTIEDAGPRPEPTAYSAPVEPPDPLFENGWGSALRSAIADPSWIDQIRPDLADATRNRVEQLTMHIDDLHTPTVRRPTAFSTSVTNLVALAECPLKFRWIHHERLPRRPRASARRGTEFHRMVELHNQGVATFDDAIAPGRDLVDPESASGEASDRTADPWVAFTASRFHDDRPIMVETPFEITFEGRSLRGKVDAVYATDDGWEIVDYKSGSENTTPAKRVQLEAYALAAATGVLAAEPPASLAVTFAYFGETPAVEITETVDERWLQAATSSVSELLRRGELGPFDANPTDGCRWCDFLHHCGAGRAHVERTKRRTR